MSHEASAWAFAVDEEELPMGAKFLLVAIANFADRSGVCFPGRSALASACSCSERTVSAHMATLEEMFLIARAPRRRANGSRTSDWMVLAPGGSGRGQMTDPDESVPDEVRSLALGRSPDGPPGGVKIDDLVDTKVPANDNVQIFQVKVWGGPEPSVFTDYPRVVEELEEEQTRGADGMNDGQMGFAIEASPVEPPPGFARRPARAHGRRVTPQEWAKACEVLGQFNEALAASGRRGRFRSESYVKMVLKVVREFPELSAQDHRRVIDRVLGDPTPWWSGSPHPGLVYGGSGSVQFERCLNDDGSERRLRGVDHVAATIDAFDRMAAGGAA